MMGSMLGKSLVLGKTTQDGLMRGCGGDGFQFPFVFFSRVAESSAKSSGERAERLKKMPFFYFGCKGSSSERCFETHLGSKP